MMCENWDLKELNRLEQAQARLVLKRKMLEQKAINGGPEDFDFWADQIDECDEQLRRRAIKILELKAEKFSY